MNEAAKWLFKVIYRNNTTAYNPSYCEEVQTVVIIYFDSAGKCIEKGNRSKESFVRFVQIFSDKTAPTMRFTALATHFVLTILLNILVTRRKWLMTSKDTKEVFLPICRRKDQR